MDTRNINSSFPPVEVNQDTLFNNAETRVLNQCSEFSFKQDKDVLCPPTHYLNFRCLDDEDTDLIYNEPIGKLPSADQATIALTASTKAKRMRISQECCARDR